MKKRTILCSVLAAVLLPVAMLSGQTFLDLHKAIDLSLKDNSRYAVTREKVSESRLKIKEAWGSLWPDLSISAAETRYHSDKGLYSLMDGQDDVQFIKGTLSLNPGVFYNSLKSARDGYVISVNEERKIMADTVMNTIELYFRILLTSEIKKQRSDSVKALEENLRVVTAGYQSGSYTTLDILRAKVTVANEKTRLIMAEDDYRNAKAALNVQMGRDMNVAFELDSDTLNVGENEISGITNLSEEAQNARIEELIAGAVRNRPEIIQVQYKKKNALDSARAVESVYLWPTIFVNAGYGTSRNIEKTGATAITTGNPQMDSILGLLEDTLSPSGWNKSWTFTVGASFRWGSLLPLDPSHAKSAEFRSRAKQTDLEMDDFVRSLRFEIQQKFLKLVSAAHAIQSQKDNVKSAEEYFRVAVIQFKTGMIDNTKFLEANVELQNAKTLFIQALFDFQTSKAELNRSIGYDCFTF